MLNTSFSFVRKVSVYLIHCLRSTMEEKVSFPFIYVRNVFFVTKEWAEDLYQSSKGDYNLVPLIDIEGCLR